ncbi:BTB/POZ domain-containing protein At1g01640-like [Phragmites australis]|uniref:BTB/POZ domain-containing protein At1g01640-like n=1 Tax=Phragmites australis TaxID=29695 RepID=UPI002D78347A|nr:BTB/POZ domain-containing protein At1g01640-like [Phragmites australis]
MASMYMLPRTAVCAPCYEGAKAIIAFLSSDEQEEDDGHGSVKSRGSIKPNSSTKGMRDAWEGVKEMRNREEEASHRAAYLQQGLALAWEEGIHTDIVVKPGTGGPIPAHKVILAARSKVFRHMLSSDEHCKAPADDSISLPDLSHDGLSLFLAFLYTGALDQDLPERHLHALLIAGDKYDVLFLRRACEARLAVHVEPRNTLRTLEIANAFLDITMAFIEVREYEDQTQNSAATEIE